MNIRNQFCQSSVTCLGPFLTNIASLLTDHFMSGRPIHAKYEHFRTIGESILPRISILLPWSGGHQCMVLILCRVESSFSPTHNIVPHISWHDQPCHKTMKKYEEIEGMVISLLHPRKFAIRTWFCNCPQYFLLISHSLWVQPKYTWSKKDVGSHKSTSLLSTFHIGLIFLFLSSQFYVIHIHR